MKQQTAVDYLVEKLNQCEPFYSGIVSLAHKQHIDGLIEQAKEMEKAQRIKDYNAGYVDAQFNHINDAVNYVYESEYLKK